MDPKILKLDDKFKSRDTQSFEYKPSVLHRTKIIGGYNHHINPKTGISELGEVLFEEENQIVLGGALFILEKIFGVQSPIQVDYLNNIMGIATDGEPINEIYPKDTVVCLFGVGTGGCGDTITSVKDVKFYEREIMQMIPFRVTVANSPLNQQEATQYWFKKLNTDGTTSYYLKKFELDPQIKVLWKDAEGDEDGTEVEPGVHNTTRTEPIESFVEILLNISKKDIREWFEIYGNIEETRINSIGLFTGILGQLADGSYDYKQVKLFSKLNINNEMLTLAKDLTIIYRIYTS
jgi:hypothetical protein